MAFLGYLEVTVKKDFGLSMSWKVREQKKLSIEFIENELVMEFTDYWLYKVVHDILMSCSFSDESNIKAT
jgi:hypothetical protein